MKSYFLRIQYAGLTLECLVGYTPGTPPILNPPDRAHPGDPPEIEFESIKAVGAQGQPVGVELLKFIDQLTEGDFVNVFSPLVEQALEEMRNEQLIANYERRSDYAD